MSGWGRGSCPHSLDLANLYCKAPPWGGQLLFLTCPEPLKIWRPSPIQLILPTKVSCAVSSCKKCLTFFYCVKIYLFWINRDRRSCPGPLVCYKFERVAASVNWTRFLDIGTAGMDKVIFSRLAYYLESAQCNETWKQTLKFMESESAFARRSAMCEKSCWGGHSIFIEMFH